ncbi:MAG: hypothetical protein UZ07_CHB004002540 [Chlorobi bacterium OLB7]|nr:MAG: hypothetical protein UZ07_CHB004002540 [Chlorobi bacterium OLB7]
MIVDPVDKILPTDLGRNRKFAAEGVGETQREIGAEAGVERVEIVKAAELADVESGP